MWKRCIAVCMVLVCLFCITSPAFAVYYPPFPFVPTDPLTTETLVGLFYSLSGALGLRGTILDEEAVSSSTPIRLGLQGVVEEWITWTGLSGIQYCWDNIMNDVYELGQVQMSDKKYQNVFAIPITENNSKWVRNLAMTVEEFLKYKYNDDAAQNWEFTDINESYGGYLSYAEQFIGDYVNFNITSSTGGTSVSSFTVNRLVGTASPRYYMRSVGMDLWGVDSSGNTAQILEFNPGDNSIILLNNPVYNWTTASGIVYYLTFPVTVRGTVEVALSRPSSGITQGDTDPLVYWGNICLFDETGYQAFLDRTSGNMSMTSNQFTIGNILSATSTTNSSGTVTEGFYYAVAQLYMTGGRNRPFSKNTPYYPTNEIGITFDQISYFNAYRLGGVARPYGWNVEIDDSGTGTPVIIPNGISSPYDGAFDVGSTLYFPAYLDNGLQLDDVLNTDLVVTGEGVLPSDPSDPGDNNNSGPPVSIDIIPPGSLGLESIWHYVSDTYTYCVDYLSVMIDNVFTIVPVPVFNLAFATVVLGILFGLYKRFIK